jgi:selenide,water dikinase
MTDPNLLVGTETADDAAVYRLNETTALILTTDFFTPVVDDPFIFGQIAATNALSDIYAMGGQPLLALNIVCFPNCLSTDILGLILQGGASKVIEAGAVIAGGHTVQDDEPKYGLAVAGLIHPDKVLTNAKARIGDVLILTKPLGTGIINTAIKGELAAPEAEKKAVETMTELNKAAAQAMQATGVHACTDITGFGLLGHAAEMARGSGLSIQIDSSSVLFLPEVKNLASMGMIPAGAYHNKNYLAEDVYIKPSVDDITGFALYDPQTSGGLLIAVEEEKKDLLMENLSRNGVQEFAAIGKVVDRKDCLISVA